MNFDVLAKTGLRGDDIADLFGVSRMTIHNWESGKTKPRRSLRMRVQRILDVLQLAVDEGLLPPVQRSYAGTPLMQQLQDKVIRSE